MECRPLRCNHMNTIKDIEELDTKLKFCLPNRDLNLEGV